MPKFGQVQFNEDYFGDGRVPKTFRKQSIRGIPLGYDVRRSIANRVTFRVRTGNGYYGSIAGHRYQDKYKFFVSDPTASHCPDAAKTCFANAVAAWQGLAAAAKKRHNDWAQKMQYLSGFNLYIRRYMKENY